MTMLNNKELVGLRKLTLEYIRYLPIIQSILVTIVMGFLCFGIKLSLFPYLISHSLNSLLLYYIVGIYQKWCWKFKLSIYYLFIVLILSFIDLIYKLPINDKEYGYLTISIFISFLLYYLIRKKYDKCNNDGV